MGSGGRAGATAPMRTTLSTILLTLAMLMAGIPAQALTVSPARFEVAGDPGTTLSGEIELFNEQEGTRTFYVSFENFEPKGDSGAPHFVGAKEGLATWLQADQTVTVAFGERVLVPFSIAIPENAEPGGYFAAIFFGSQPPEGTGGGEVTIGGKIGVLVLLRVTGEVAEGGGLTSFAARDNQRVFTSLPIAFEYRLTNEGGDRVVPRGEIKIKNSVRLTSATLLANENDGSVLPGSTRKFHVTWGSEQDPGDEAETGQGFFAAAMRQLRDFHFGWYTARMDLSWGETNQTAAAAYHFLVIPWQLLSLLLIVLLALWFVGKTGLKRYNRFIVAQAMRKYQ